MACARAPPWTEQDATVHREVADERRPMAWRAVADRALRSLQLDGGGVQRVACALRMQASLAIFEARHHVLGCERCADGMVGRTMAMARVQLSSAVQDRQPHTSECKDEQ